MLALKKKNAISQTTRKPLWHGFDSQVGGERYSHGLFERGLNIVTVLCLEDDVVQIIGLLCREIRGD